LYCNDDWTSQDGGALRIYEDSTQLVSADDLSSLTYTEILPKNGRLLIFDSKLVHSVEKVTTSAKKRRALTIWIKRPIGGGVQGEIMDVPP
jgi:Rps23 Pro-64 3,4-dihydroxylase Tpa1-like proline 4-hydroxylase